MNFEVCVLGGGPAGAAFALRLAQIGREVALIEKHPFPRPHIGESLPPGILPLLDGLGLQMQIESAGFLRPCRAIVRWGTQREIDREGFQQPGFQVDRGRFDRILLEAAREAGAAVLQPAQAERPIRDGEAGWRIPVRLPGSRKEIRARFIADASGRRALLGGRKVRSSAPTLALYAYWRKSGLSGPETRVEAGRSEWYWGAPLPDGSFNATVFIDPQRLSAGSGGQAVRLEDLYRQLLRSSDLLRGCLQGELCGAVTACDATSFSDSDPVGPDWIKLGEAAMSIDPLSSQGVQAAIRSGIQGAAVANTLIRYPQDSQAALEFYRQRHQETLQHHSTLSTRFYAEMALESPHAFWQARAQSVQGIPQPSPSRTSHPRGLRRAFRPHEKLLLSPQAEFVQIAVMEHDWITRRPALKHPALNRPVAFLGGRELAPLLASLSQAEAACRIVDRWSRCMPPSQAQQILDWLWKKGIVLRADVGISGQDAKG